MLDNAIIELLHSKQYYSVNHNRGHAPDGIGFGLMHYALIRNFRPAKVLCVGSLKGYIPAICALACKDEGIGQVEFVDEGKDSWGGANVWASATSDYFKPLGIENYITITASRIEDYPLNEYQYIYLDADHSYEGVKRHFDLLYPKLSSNGIFAMHDVNLSHLHSKWGDFGVGKFWDEIKGEKIKLPFVAGLGIIRKA